MQVAEISPCVVLNPISWDGYLQIDEIIGQSGGGARLKFADNQLEIMSPVSDDHEYIKGNIGGMIQAHCQQHKFFYQFRGNATIRKEGMRGGEPDESYIFTKGKESIDLAIEIALTSGGIDKLDFYRPLEIPEIWIWENKSLNVYVFTEGDYTNSDSSKLLPEIDLSLIEELATWDYLSEVLEAFRDRLDAS